MSNMESAVTTSSAPIAVPMEPAAAQEPPKENIDPTGLIEDHILPKLDPEFLEYFVDVIAKAPPGHTVDLKDMRANPEKYRPSWAVDTSGYERVADHEVTSEDGAKFVVRVYHPDPEEFGDGPYGAHLNFHGGGFVTGDLQVEAQLCLSMREAGVVVVDVDYRRCPESVFGKAFQDAWAALNWTRDNAASLNVDPTSLSIGGVSAGGHISIVLQHLARDADIPLKLCMPTVPPSTDSLGYKYYTDSPFQSFHDFHRAPILPWKRIRWFGQFCISQDQLPKLRAMWPEWWLAPLRAPNWKGLCHTYIRTAEIDPLRDEGEAYGMKLIAGGNQVTMKRYMGSPHTFMYFKFMKTKHEFDSDSIRALRVAHGVGWGNLDARGGDSKA
ncbi:Alpha/Beta hydrolase protein [Rhypophila decipiens]|uniref:Alpha/Beta hydrolase protein n=1 Tax=Rhypophila decipiens TaxID=261697 RepID=A0AAN6Y268_9PEZI|nr:Alpha/Beta hydrolase protein [Rhypophila decipiens]